MRCRSYLLIAGILAAFALMSGGAYALSVSDGTFSPQQGVRQGETYSTDVLVRNSPDKSNHFLMAVGGDVGGWVSNINPAEFNLSAGETRLVTLTILVPMGATRGMHSGTATATGTQIIGSGIGYQEAARGNIWADVVSEPASGGGSATPPGNFTNSTNSTQGDSGSVSNPGNNTATNNTIAPPSNATQCTAEVLICPDGSYVSRNPNANCTFTPCPNVSVNPIVNNTPAVPAPNPGTAVTVISPPSSNSGGGGSSSSTSSGASGGGTAPISRTNSSSGAASQARATLPVQGTNNTILPVLGSAEHIVASPAFMRAAPVLRVIDETKGVLETQTASVEYTGRLEVKESNIFMDTSAGLKQILLLPEDAIKASETPGKEDVKKVELKEESQKPVYSVTGTRKAKFLYILPVSIDVETNIDAENGKVVSVNKPWWSFLAFD